MGAANSKSSEAFRTIGEVAGELDVPQHVLRFWEAKFPHIRPIKRGGGRRYYRPDDVDLLRSIRQLLHENGYTIKGVQKLLRENGPGALRLAVSVRLVSDSGDLPAGRAKVPPQVEDHDSGHDSGVSAAAGQTPQDGQSLATIVQTLEKLRRTLAAD
jgi:DNA-binding transcriptional MerR regulator